MKNQIKKLSILILIITFFSLEPFAQSEPLIPTNFTTYTDEVNLFSISYPENWEPAFSMIERFKQETSDYLESIDEEGFSEINNVVFFGGILLDNGYYNPNITITIFAKPLGADNVKLEDIVEIMVPEYKKYSEEYCELSRTKTIIGGKQAIILDFEACLPNMPLAHYLVMYMFIDKYLWTTTCSIGPPLDFYDFKDDIYAMVKSLKILK